MKYFFSVLTILSVIFISVGQDTIEGTIPDYTSGEGQVISGLAAPIIIGEISEEGSFTIPLTGEYKDQLLSSIETKNAGRSDWKTSIPTIEKSYGNCANGKLDITGGEQTAISLTTIGMFAIGSMEEQKLYGKFTYASDMEFAQDFLAFGKFKVRTGYQLDWMYVEEPASVKGNCSLESYAVNAEETYNFKSEYDLDFKPGWNIVKYEILEVFTDRDGKQYVMHERSTVIDSLPEDVEVCFIAN